MSLDRRFEIVRQKSPALARTIEARHGFITKDEVQPLIDIDRFLPVLVRCGNGRFTTAVQSLEWFIGIIEEHSRLKSNEGRCDYIRDVCIPAESHP